MATARDVAIYIQKVACPDIGDLKLQKLMYYANAWHLVWAGAPLFEELPQAWIMGPVVPSVYQDKAIRQATADGLSLSAYETAAIDSVCKFYGEHHGGGLMDLTHDEAPWIRARAGLKPGERSQNAIDPIATQNFYAMKQAKGEPCPEPVRPPRSERIKAASEQVFADHAKLFEALA